VHPYITGVPHRIAAFEQLLIRCWPEPETRFMTRQGINDWYRQQVPAPR
jgi:hypothetical protein